MSRHLRALAPLVLLPGLASVVLPGTAHAAPEPPPPVASSVPEVLDTVGTDFWTAIPRTISTQSPKTLYISPTADGSVTVTLADGTEVATRALVAGQVVAVTLPATVSLDQVDGVAAKGIHVEATVPVSVYGTVIQQAASTGYQAYPTDALGTRYRVLGYQGLHGTTSGSRLTVVAPEDDTTVTITPTGTLGSRAAGTPYEVQLDEGDAYQISAPLRTQDVSGTEVVSDKPVAVLGGAGCTNIPVGFAACNPILAQVTPVATWGTEFVSSRLATRAKGDTYRVLADTDDTVVSVNGVEKATIDAGKFWEGVLPEGVTTPGPGGVQIETSEPALVAQYSNGTQFDNTNGDPMMSLVPPVAQLLTSYVVAVPDVSGQSAMQGYLNVVARTADLGQVLLNGTAIPAEDFTALAGTDYSVLQKQVPAGQYSLQSPSRVGITVYELGQADGFMFPGGHALAAIADAPPPPTAEPLTSSGSGVSSVVVPFTEGQGVELVDGSTASRSVTIDGQGTYALDPVTGTITFTPVAGFSGPASPVTYRVRDGFNQSTASTYTASVVAPAPPVVTPRTSSGSGSQSTTVAVPSGSSISLLAGDVLTTEVEVPEGTYLLDRVTGTISFVPRAGFTGTATAVTFQLVDAYNQTSTSTYTAQVLAAVVPPTTPAVGKGVVGVRGAVKVASGTRAFVPVTCRAARGALTSCTVTILAKVNGTTTVIGTGTWRQGAGKVRLNSAGRALASQPGGVRSTISMIGSTSDGGRVADTATTRVVTQRFTLARRVLFSSESARVTATDRSWLRSAGRAAGTVRRVTCVGHTDSQGAAPYNRALSRQRAANACSALGLPKRVKVVVRAVGRNSPVAANSTDQGRQLNRRATVTFQY